ncbi:MAG TPA: molybdopterin-synthase adenylyltransferase MoeB [Candidatus Methylacidiphilales bacterium]|nr:molybdopterin-synthase adenylyltransferase MoeB [Candidatus Methylacidiphilales bacterium]
MAFSKDEIRRYGRHLIMPEMTLTGQQKLKAARVLTVGTGGLGAPALMYLAAAGVGHIGLVDFDTVDYSNLHRQIIHKTTNVGKPKIESAIETMRDINPYVKVTPYEVALRSDNAMDIIKDYDIVVDGTDNFATRYLVNDACVLLDKPNVYGSIFRFDGMSTVFWASKGPCYRCLSPEPPPPDSVPSCAEGGVLGVLPGIIGTMQAIETVKLITGMGEPLFGRMIHFDALKMKYREIKIRKDPACEICGANATIKELIDYDQFCGVVPHRKKHVGVDETDVADLEKALEDRAEANGTAATTGKDFDLVDVREPHEYEIAKIDGSVLIPLRQLTDRIHELDSARTIYLICKNGERSAKAWKLLYDAGFRKLHNVSGGMDAWSEDIDPNIPSY